MESNKGVFNGRDDLLRDDSAEDLLEVGSSDGSMIVSAESSRSVSGPVTWRLVETAITDRTPKDGAVVVGDLFLDEFFSEFKVRKGSTVSKISTHAGFTNPGSGAEVSPTW